MSKRYALKGINDDESVCLVCGKVELKRVMWLVALDSDGNEVGDPFHAGTTCGAKLMGYTQSKINTAVKNFPGQVYRMREALANGHPAMVEYNKSLRQAQAQGLDFKARKEAGLLDYWRNLQAEAQQWAEAQPVSVEL